MNEISAYIQMFRACDDRDGVCVCLGLSLLLGDY